MDAERIGDLLGRVTVAVFDTALYLLVVGVPLLIIVAVVRLLF